MNNFRQPTCYQNSWLCLCRFAMLAIPGLVRKIEVDTCNTGPPTPNHGIRRFTGCHHSRHMDAARFYRLIRPEKIDEPGLVGAQGPQAYDGRVATAGPRSLQWSSGLLSSTVNPSNDVEISSGRQVRQRQGANESSETWKVTRRDCSSMRENGTK